MEKRKKNPNFRLKFSSEKERQELVNFVLGKKVNKKALLSESPIDLSKVKPEDVDKEILRLGIIAEMDAVNLYEQLASRTKSGRIKQVLLDIAKEEKTHIGEFQALLLEIDKEHENELNKGKSEIEEIIKKIKNISK